MSHSLVYNEIVDQESGDPFSALPLPPSGFFSSDLSGSPLLEGGAEVLLR